MEKYHKEIPQEYIDFTKSSLLKNNALRFETLGNLLSMLNTMTAYNLPADYIKQEEKFVKGLTIEKSWNSQINILIRQECTMWLLGMLKPSLMILRRLV